MAIVGSRVEGNGLAVDAFYFARRVTVLPNEFVVSVIIDGILAIRVVITVSRLDYGNYIHESLTLSEQSD